jgi:hypothetical protein
MEETKITFKFDGQEKVYDISDPAQREEAVKDIELGNLHKKKEKEIAETLKAVKSKAEMYDKFDTWMNAIKNGSADPKEFVTAIQEATGLKLSVKDKEDIMSGDFEDDDKVAQIYKKVQSLESELKKAKTENFWQAKQEAATAKLSVKYDGKNGMPPYNQKEVDEYCAKTGFFLNDPEEHYEGAYLRLHQTDIEKAKTEQQKQKELELKRRQDYIDGGAGSGVDFKDKPISVKGKSYNKLVEETAQKLKDEGVPIFIDD